MLLQTRRWSLQLRPTPCLHPDIEDVSVILMQYNALCLEYKIPQEGHHGSAIWLLKSICYDSPVSSSPEDNCRKRSPFEVFAPRLTILRAVTRTLPFPSHRRLRARA